MTLEILLAIIFATTPLDPGISMQCGFKPFRPLGCSGEPVCACDKDKNCQWVWLDC